MTRFDASLFFGSSYSRFDIGDIATGGGGMQSAIGTQVSLGRRELRLRRQRGQSATRRAARKWHQETLRPLAIGKTYQRRHGTQSSLPSVISPLHHTGKAVREKSNLLNRFNLIWAVQLSSQIYTSSLSPQISGYFRASRLDKRGVSRSSRTRGGMRWTRGVGAEGGCRAGQTRERFTSRRTYDADAYGKTVWS